ncbi:hypothetical protein [Streptomyces goshikiensis]|uniref:hypothetical protein n=1 Tax=Streptomyces goshikiensis TaxID=1942 RepID=UPI0036988A6A
MHEQLTLFPDSEIISPEQPVTPALRILPLNVPAEIPAIQSETLPFDEDAA